MKFNQELARLMNQEIQGAVVRHVRSDYDPGYNKCIVLIGLPDGREAELTVTEYVVKSKQKEAV